MNTTRRSRARQTQHVLSGVDVGRRSLCRSGGVAVVIPLGCSACGRGGVAVVTLRETLECQSCVGRVPTDMSCPYFSDVSLPFGSTSHACISPLAASSQILLSPFRIGTALWSGNTMHLFTVVIYQWSIYTRFCFSGGAGSVSDVQRDLSN